MAVFSHNTDTNILFASAYARTLLNAGYSKEHVLTSLSKKHFGRVSIMAKRIIEMINKGLGFHDALLAEAEKERHANIKRLIGILNADDSVNISPMLLELDQRIMKDKELSADNMIDSMSSSLQKMMLVCALPIAIFFVVFLQDALPSLAFIPRPQLDYLVYGISVMILLILIMRMRMHDN
jgi:hypothetical protein